MAGSNEVLLVGKAELDSIYESLKKVMDQADKGAREIQGVGKKTNDTLERSAKKAETSIKATGSQLRRLAGQLYSDFKALMSLNAVAGAMKLSSQFAGSVKESIKLSDSIRRLGGSFGLAKDQFGQFQGKLARGLGDIGASSEAAAEALEGLAGFGVKGMDSAGNLAKGAVTLAGMSGERGGEKNIARLLASTLQSQGKDVNDRSAQQSLVGEVTAAVQATGKQASEILGAMDQIFSTMDKSLRGKIGPEAMSQMAVMATTAGPAATKALQEYLSKGAIQRLPLEAQGFNVFGKDGGLDMKELKRFIDTTSKRGLSPRESLMTAGFSEEAAEGLVRLADASKAVEENLTKLSTATRDNEQAYRESMGLFDALKGSVNTLKGRFEEATQGFTQKLTDFFAAQVGDTAGSAAVVGGGATLAALLAGGGLRGIGSLMKGAAKEQLIEGVTGEQVQKVFVVNADQMGGVGAVGGAGKLGQALAVAGAGAAGYAVGSQVVNPALDKYTQGKTDEGFEGNAAERLFFKLDKMLGGESSKQFMQNQVKVEVFTKEPNLKAKTQPSRGRSN